MVGERTEELVKVDLEDVKFRRLFVGNIDHNWDDDIIKEYFCNIGSVQVQFQKQIYKKYLLIYLLPMVLYNKNLMQTNIKMPF